MEAGREVPKKLNVFALFAGNLSSNRRISYHPKAYTAGREAGLVELSSELRRVFGRNRLRMG
jgi:hypothetical protein